MSMSTSATVAIASSSTAATATATACHVSGSGSGSGSAAGIATKTNVATSNPSIFFQEAPRIGNQFEEDGQSIFSPMLLTDNPMPCQCHAMSCALK
jgi:hypothetical protein